MSTSHVQQTAQVSIRRHRLGAVEIAIIVSGCVLVAFAAGFLGGAAFAAWAFEESRVPRAEDHELQRLQAKYGEFRNSENAEEWIVRDFFNDRREGVFVDVGANDYQKFSNTYYLEAVLGWSGIAIDPQSKFAEQYRLHRPRTKFQALFVSDSSDREAVLNVPENGLIASADAQFARTGGRDATPLRVPTSTLDDILDRAGIAHVDFLTMDIELAEPGALRGFSIERFRPALVCVEAHPEVRQQILDYFAAHGYTVVGKYLRADTDNLWFTVRR